MLRAGAALAALTLAAGLAYADGTTPAVTTNSLSINLALSLPGGQKITSFDISYVDTASHTYILADRTNKSVDVWNTQTKAFIMQAGKGIFAGATGNNDTSGPDGVMIVNSTQIWAGDGNSTLKILRLSDGTLVNTINTAGAMPATVGFTGNRVDEMCFDAVDNVALTANDAATPAPFISFHDLGSGAVTAQIVFDGAAGNGPNATNGIEQCQFNPRTKKFYLNLPEVNGPGNNSQPGAVVVLDPVEKAIVAVYSIPLSSCSGPQGLVIGPAPQMLLGCNGGPTQAGNGFPTAIIDDGSTGGPPGGVLAVLLNQAGADQVDFNPVTNTYVLAESNHNPPPPNGTASCTTSPPTAGPQLLGIVNAITKTSGPSVVAGLFNCPAPNNHGNNHSVAAAPDAAGAVFFPVASTSGSTLCGSGGGSNTVGCVAVLLPRLTPTHDFDGNGVSDVLWRDTGGDVAMWLMNGAQIAKAGGLGTMGTNWSIVGQRDFNKDGNADILWMSNAGDLSMWFMNGTNIASGASLGTISTSWSIVGTGDFNGDSHGDIVLRDGSGNVAIWLMNGGTIQSSILLGQVDLAWTVVGVGDFNGDGRSDILWRNTGGDLVIWFMNGAQISSSGLVANVPTVWSVVGTGDFNADGKTDILWRNTSGDVALWMMNGNTIASASSLGNVPASWSVSLTGDFNGDGSSDIVWRNTSGDVAMWFVNAGTISSGASVGNVPIAWTIQSMNAE